MVVRFEFIISSVFNCIIATTSDFIELVNCVNVAVLFFKLDSYIRIEIVFVMFFCGIFITTIIVFDLRKVKCSAYSIAGFFAS